MLTRHAVKHADELRIFMQLDNTVHYDEAVKMTSYDLIRKDRNRNGRGVSLYVRNTIPYSDRNDLLANIVEAICIEINKPNSKPLC